MRYVPGGPGVLLYKEALFCPERRLEKGDSTARVREVRKWTPT